MAKSLRSFLSQKRGTGFPPAVTFNEFAEHLNISATELKRVFMAARRDGPPPPKPFVRNSTSGHAYYNREELLSWWRRVKNKDPLTCKTIDTSDPVCSNATDNQGEPKMTTLKNMINEWTKDDPEGRPTSHKLKPIKERAFDWLKDNPSSTSAEAARALANLYPDIQTHRVAGVMHSLVESGLADKTPFTTTVRPFGQRTQYRYYTIVDKYPERKAWGEVNPPSKTKGRPKAKAGIQSLLAINKGEGKGNSQGNSHAVKRNKATEVQAQPAHKPSVDDYLDTLSVNEAYQLYSRLKGMFDAK